MYYFPIWDQLHKHEQEMLLSHAKRIHFAKGDLVHTEGDCMGLLLVVEGQLRAYMVSEDGREITVYRLFARDICLFSASCIMRSIQFDITISAEKDTDTFLIPPAVYRRIMEGSAPLANYTSEVMASRFSDVMWLMDQILWKSFDRRLADFLLNETRIEETQTLCITHEEIGRHMGHPREVVTRMLQYFQGEGMVQLSRGKVRVTDSKKLQKIIEPKEMR